jgi:hypothetical protein
MLVGVAGIGIRTAATGLGQQTNNYMVYSVYILDTGQYLSLQSVLEPCFYQTVYVLYGCHRHNKESLQPVIVGMW